MNNNGIIQEMKDHMAFLEAENKKLKKENAKLKKQNSDAGWQYEYDHVNDWRTPIEMGQL